MNKNVSKAILFLHFFWSLAYHNCIKESNTDEKHNLHAELQHKPIPDILIPRKCMSNSGGFGTDTID